MDENSIFIVPGKLRKLGLKKHTIEKMNSAFAQFSTLGQLMRYCSRPKGTYRPGSDINLILPGPAQNIKALTILFALTATLSLSAQHPYRNLVFEGAGIKGIAYAGAVKQLEEQDVMQHIEKVGGTSAGAITALMVSLGYSSAEIYELISATKFHRFNKGGFWVFGGLHRLNKRFGWYKGKQFEQWLEAVVEAKTGNPDITFQGLVDEGFLELHVTATCLNRQELIVFSQATYPAMKVKDAVRVSMSIPLYFEANFIDSEGRLYKNITDRAGLDVVVDGGIIGNYPIALFDSDVADSSGQLQRVPNAQTLGLRIDSDEQIAHDKDGQGLAAMEITSLESYTEAFYVLVLERLNRSSLTEADWERTISISSVGIGPRIKRMKPEEKERLMQSGQRAVADFFGQQAQQN